MFGSLVNTKQNKMLTFVENSDLESALSRTKRPKVHISCEVCRTRKIKCSGNSSGCTRCVSMGVQCKYPPRESRKRKSMTPTKVTQPVKTPDGHEWESTTAQGGASCYLESSGDENSGRSWTVGETSITQSEGSTDLIMTEDMFLDVDPEPLQEKTSSISWDDPTDSGWWPSDIDYTATHVQSPSLMFGSHGDDVNIQMDDVQQVISLLQPIETGSVNPGSLSRQSSTRSQAQQVSEHDQNSRAPSSTSSPSDASCSGLAPDSWTTSQPIQSKRNGRDSTEQAHVQYGVVGHRANRCSCLHRAALFLVELGQINARIEHGSLAMLLGHFRQGLRTFGTLIECDQCNSVDESSTLNVVAARCLGVLCENVVNSYVATVTMGSNYHEVPSRAAEEIWYSSYSIHDDYERQEVLRCIVSVQICQLRCWLEKLKAWTSNSKKHGLLMSEVEQQVKRVASILSNHERQEYSVK